MTQFLIVSFGFPLKIPATATVTATKTSKKKYFFTLSPNREPVYRLAFLYISLPSPHDFDVKVPNFTF